MTRSRERSAPQPQEPSGEFGRALASIRRQYGDNIVRRGVDKPQHKHIPTGIFTLDLATFGGIPEGLITYVFGWESSGKSTIAARAVAGAQRKYPDHVAVFVDAEGTFDPGWAAFHGVDVERMYLVQPESGEQALDIAVAVLKAQESSIIVVDSLAALMPHKEGESSVEDSLPGRQAQFIGRFCRQVKAAQIKETGRGHNPAMLWINQWRKAIGVLRGDPRVLPGGFAPKFFSSLSFEVTNKEHLGEDEREVETVDHNKHGFTIKKCKLGTGVRSGEFKMVRNPSSALGQGFIDDASTVATWAKKGGIISGGGGSFRIDGVDGTFRTLADIHERFYQDRELFERIKYRLVCDQREACGLQREGWW